ncbi:MAG TPA: hypothetical protein VGL10_02385, partial [Gammaproteobacteria bacterium]
VVTLAGNLDIDAWTRRHKYLPLSGSLNPLLQTPLPATIRQIHIVGADDDNVYPEFIAGFVKAQSNKADFRLYPHQGHICCWQEAWPDILAGLRQ